MLSVGVHRLAVGDFVLEIEPEAGGSIARFDWRGEPIFRRRCGEGPLNSASFPLVPFSNRIAFGRFEVDGETFSLAPNFPGQDHPHTLHGFGWLGAWKVASADDASISLKYLHEADEWPWPFEAEQRLSLTPAGLRHDLSVRNLGVTPMPAGLGFHPYFPATPRARYVGFHNGEWQTSADGLPVRLQREREARDWWDGQPIAARDVDTAYVERSGPLEIFWPERGMALRIDPSPALRFTIVYAPAGVNFFCVEPVSHETDALNRKGRRTGLRWLEAGDTFAVYARYTPFRTGEVTPS